MEIDLDVVVKNKIRDAETLLAHALDSLENDKIPRGICKVKKAREILDKLLKEYSEEQARRRQAKRDAGDWTMDQ